MSHHGHFWRRPNQRSSEPSSSSSRSAPPPTQFKLIILLTTLRGDSRRHGRAAQGALRRSSLWSSGRQAARRALGLPVPRPEIDSEWTRYRLQGVSDSHSALIGVYKLPDPAIQKLMRYAGMDPDHGLLRWGNLQPTLLLPSTVFEADDTGRSYRLRPCIESVWLRQISPEPQVFMFFLVPDGPGLKEAMRGTTAILVQESRQTTNSWGLRGPEPDLDAPLRGLVLGDSFMQGLFIGDDDTPPECLKRISRPRSRSGHPF